MADSTSRCPSCNSAKLTSVQTRALDSELLECQDVDQKIHGLMVPPWYPNSRINVGFQARKV